MHFYWHEGWPQKRQELDITIGQSPALNLVYAFIFMPSMHAKVIALLAWYTILKILLYNAA